MKVDNSKAVFCSEMFYISHPRALHVQEAVSVIIPIPFADSLHSAYATGSQQPAPCLCNWWKPWCHTAKFRSILLGIVPSQFLTVFFFLGWGYLNLTIGLSNACPLTFRTVVLFWMLNLISVSGTVSTDCTCFLLLGWSLPCLVAAAVPCSPDCPSGTQQGTPGLQ